MVAIKLEKLSEKELKALVRDAGQELERRGKANRTTAMKRLDAVAKEFGFSLRDLTGVGLRNRKRAVAASGETSPAPGARKPPLYRSPSDPSKTWSGHGKRPQWFKDHVEAGGDAKELLIRRRGRKPAVAVEAQAEGGAGRTRMRKTAAKAHAAASKRTQTAAKVTKASSPRAKMSAGKAKTVSKRKGVATPASKPTRAAAVRSKRTSAPTTAGTEATSAAEPSA